MHCYTGYALHARCDPFTHTHVQDGCTALWLAYYNEHEATAAELIEATKRAGALDLQVGHEVWVRVWYEGRGQGVGASADAERE